MRSSDRRHSLHSLLCHFQLSSLIHYTYHKPHIHRHTRRSHLRPTHHHFHSSSSLATRSTYPPTQHHPQRQLPFHFRMFKRLRLQIRFHKAGGAFVGGGRSDLWKYEFAGGDDGGEEQWMFRERFGGKRDDETGRGCVYSGFRVEQDWRPPYVLQLDDSGRVFVRQSTGTTKCRPRLTR